MDEDNLYDEFGNYIGPDLDDDSDDEELADDPWLNVRRIIDSLLCALCLA
jgi:hypothetical protein